MDGPGSVEVRRRIHGSSLHGEGKYVRVKQVQLCRDATGLGAVSNGLDGGNEREGSRNRVAYERHPITETKSTMSKLNRVFQTFWVSLAAGALLFTLAACDSGGTNSEEPLANEFSFSVTEMTSSSTSLVAKQQATTTLDGFSFFFEGEDPESSDKLFVIYFTQENDLSAESSNQGLFGFAVRHGQRPGIGTANFVSLASQSEPTDDFGMMLFESVGSVGAEGGSFRWYLSDGGTLEVNTSNDDRVEGTINAEAMRVSIDGSVSDTTRVTIDGTFAARSADSFVGVSPFTP